MECIMNVVAKRGQSPRFVVKSEGMLWQFPALGTKISMMEHEAR